MREFVVLSFVVCLAVAKPQFGYNYESPTAYQASGLQQQYSLTAATAAVAPQTHYTQPQSYATYPAQDHQYYQSYPTAAAPQQTAYASQELDQASYVTPNAAALQQNSYASAGQAQFDQAIYQTANQAPLEQPSFASADQAHFQQTQPLQQVAYPTASPSPLEQSSFAGANQEQFEQTQFQQAAYQTPLEQPSFATAGQAQFQQTQQLQPVAYPTASPSPLEQPSFASADQAHFQQTQPLQQVAYPTASPSPLEQSSFAGANQAQFEQTQFQQAAYQTPLEQPSFATAGQAQFQQTQQLQQVAYPTASPSPLEQTSYAENQLPLALPTAASYEGGFQPNQPSFLQQEPSPSTTFNGLTGFTAQPYQAAAYSNAYDQPQFFNAGASYTTNNADFAQLQQYSSQFTQAAPQQDTSSGTLDSFNIQSTFGPNPADVAPAAPSPTLAPQQQLPQQLPQQQQQLPQQQQQDEAQQGPADDDQAPRPGPAFNAQGPQQQEQLQQQPQQQPPQQQQPQEQAQQPQQDEEQQSPSQGSPNQSQNILPTEQIAPEPIQGRQRTQPQGPITMIQKHIYVHVPPPDFEEPEQLPPAPVLANKKRYNIIFIKAPNVARPSIIQRIQSEDKTIVYVLVKKPDDITQIAQSEIKHDKPEVFFIKYKAQTEQQAPIAAEEEEQQAQEQPEQTEELDQQAIIVEDRSKQPSQAPQFPALEGKEAQALLREEEAQQQQQPQQPQAPQPLPALPSPTRAPSNAGISPLPIDFAPAAKAAAPTQNYLPPQFR